jgi:peptidyl-prolyl cis-trans isomerase D
MDMPEITCYRIPGYPPLGHHGLRRIFHRRKDFMVLSLMRKHAKSWLIKTLIAIIAIVFVFYFGYSFTSRASAKIGYVNGEIISAAEYEKTYRNMVERLQREYKGVWNEKLIKVFDLKNRALESLITHKLISQEAKRIGLGVTEKEIQEKIMSFPAFQFQGQFDQSRYAAMLDQNRMKPEEFESTIAQELLQEKVEQFLMTFSPVTDQEVLDQYTFANRKVKVSYVEFQPDHYKSSVKPDQSGTKKYFEEHKEQYRVPEKIKIAYVVFDPEEYRKEQTISEQRLKDYYEDHINSFKEKEQVKARHILFRLAENASKEDEAKVKAKALEVLKKAKEGEDFAQLAKKYSEDPGTKKEGGDLGYFSSGQMVKPFEDAAFKLKKGEISGLVRTPFGYHIIKVEDIKEARTKSFEEVRNQIAETLIKRGAADEAHEKALTFLDQMPYQVDLKQYASGHKLTTKETDYFSQKEAIPGIGGDEKLKQTIFSLGKEETSDVMEFQDKFYIFQVRDRKASYLPSFDQVAEAVKADYVSYLAMNAAKAAAEKFLAKLKEGKEWIPLCKEFKEEPKTTGFFSRQDYVPEISQSLEAHQAAFAINQGKRYPDRVFETEKSVLVLRWEGEQGIDQKKYQEEKGNYRDMLIRTRQQVLFQEWLDYLRKNATVKITEPIEGVDVG